MLVRPPGLVIVTPGLALRSVSTSAGRRVSFEVVPLGLGLVGTLCEPGSQGHQACSTAGRSVFCQVGSLWSRTGCLSRKLRENLLESFASRALGTIEFTLPLGGWCAFRSGSYGPGQRNCTVLVTGALEYREPSSGDCVVIVKVPGGSQAISVSRAWCSACPECILRSFVS